MQLLINSTENFDQLYVALTYNINVQELLDMVLYNFEKIFQLYTNKNEEYKNKMKIGENIKKPIINISDLVIPDRKDFMQVIYDLYYSLITIGKNKSNEHFIYFSSSFFEAYINMLNSINLDNLIIVKDMIEFQRKFL